MSRAEIEDKFFIEFLNWCADPQTEKPSELLFWLDYGRPTMDNFWEWVVRFKKMQDADD